MFLSIGIAITGVGIVMAIAVASAQDLRPYEPPSTRIPRYQQQAPSSAPRLTVDDTVYERFRNDIQNMDPTEQKKLAASLRQQLKRAQQEGRYGEARYHERLLEILERVQ
jgi:hypothetical protein